MIRFHVNIDHVATVRNARGTRYPDPVLAAGLCEAAGADGITAHLREDRRHIRDDDIEALRRKVTTLLNLEMAATPEMLAVAQRVRPDVVTLVPERRQERTTEGGLDVVGSAAVESVAKGCRDAGIKLSLFIEPEAEQIRRSHAIGARQVEFHTGEYSLAPSAAGQQACLARLREGAALAHALGLEVAAGHGLTRENVIAIAAIPEVEELNLGHAVIADAVFYGLDWAVREFRAAIEAGLRRREETRT